MEESKEMILKNNQVMGLEGFNQNQNRKSNTQIITTITDSKKLFNLENHVDYRLNDCIDEEIEVCDMMCKIIEKILDEPKIDENGEIIKDREFKMITILIDKDNKSYVTASKTFYFAFKKLCSYYTQEEIKEGVKIKIIKTNVKDSVNKALSFEIV